jgi:regulator of RNase E activity RraB
MHQMIIYKLVDQASEMDALLVTLERQLGAERERQAEKAAVAGYAGGRH